MKKIFKHLLGLASIASVVAGTVYYFKKRNDIDDDEFDEDFDDEDFDLDNDLKSVSDREYVSLHTGAQAAAETVMDAAEKAEDAADAVKEKADRKSVV